MTTSASRFDMAVWASDPPVRVPPDAFAPVVSLPDQTLIAIRDCAAASPDYEVGGVLIGEVEIEGRAISLEILGHIPAEAVRSGPAHLTFTHETWQRIRVRRFLNYPGMLVVGWYHTHPGHGVFLSTMDVALHRQLFEGTPWSVALVLDNKKETWAVFWLHGETVHNCRVNVFPGTR